MSFMIKTKNKIIKLQEGFPFTFEINDKINE